AQDPLARAEPCLVEDVDDFLELGAGEVGKEGEPGDRVDDVVSNRHQAGSSAGRAVEERAGAPAAVVWGSRIPTAFTDAPAGNSPAPTAMARWNASVEAFRTSGASDAIFIFITISFYNGLASQRP